MDYYYMLTAFFLSFYSVFILWIVFIVIYTFPTVENELPARTAGLFDKVSLKLTKKTSLPAGI